MGSTRNNGGRGAENADFRKYNTRFNAQTEKGVATRVTITGRRVPTRTSIDEPAVELCQCSTCKGPMKPRMNADSLQGRGMV